MNVVRVGAALALMGVSVWLRLQAQATTLTLNTRPFNAETVFEEGGQPGAGLAGLAGLALKWQILPDLLVLLPVVWLLRPIAPPSRLSSRAVVAMGLVLILAAQWGALRRFPVSGDETSYLLQAQLLRQGQLKGPDRGELNDHFLAPSVLHRGGVRSKYQPGWPALLAVGGGWANPLLGAASLTLMFWLARGLDLEPRGAALAALGVAVSPFFVLNCASYGIHPACLCLTLLFLWSWNEQREETRPKLLAVSCLAVIALANTRIVDLLLVGLVALFWKPRRPLAWVALAASLTLGLALVAFCNFLQNGSPWLLGFTVYDPLDRWGFGPHGHSPSRALWNQSYSLLRWLAWMPAGWGLFLILGLKERGRLRWLTLAAAVQLAFYAGHFSLGVVEYGPRYWFTATLALSLCAGAGLLRAAANWELILVLHGLAHLGVTAAVCSGQVVPLKTQRDRLLDHLSHGPPALVLLQPGGGARSRDWVRFNSPYLNDYVVFAYFLSPPSNARLVRAFPAHQPYMLEQSMDGAGRFSSALQPYAAGEEVRFWVMAGENYLAEIRDPDQAACCFERVLQREPENLYAHGYLAQICSQRGDYAQAIEHSRRVLEKVPDNLKVRWQLAQDLDRAGQRQEALAEMEKVARGQGPESQRARRWIK